MSEPTAEPTPGSADSAHERLAPQTLELPLRYFGKCFVPPVLGATDWGGISDPSIFSWGEIAPSHGNTLEYAITEASNPLTWYYRILFSNLKPARLQAPRPTVYGFIGTPSLGPLHLAVAAMTEGDAQHEAELQIKSQRIWLNIVTHSLSSQRAQVADLMKRGYPVWSAMIPPERLIIYQHHNPPRINLHPAYRQRQIKRGLIETIQVSDQPILWSDPKWVEDDNLAASLASAYLSLKAGKGVDFIKSLPQGGAIDEKTCVLIAQALSHMAITQKVRIPLWITDQGVVDMPPDSLEFKSSAQPRRNVTVIDPTRAAVNDQNREVVKTIREAFIRPWPQAHNEWASRNV